MISNIGDTPQQLEQGLMFDGEVWTKDKIQALQAQVEQLRIKFNDLTSCHLNSDFNEALSKLRHALNKTPAQCLAERDAEIAAKAVDECIDIAHSKFSVTGITSALQDYANQLRKQAGGGGKQ